MRRRSKRGSRGAAPRAHASRDFVEALEAEYAQHGQRAITKLRLRRPEAFLRLVADIGRQSSQADAQSGDAFGKLLEMISDGRGRELAESLG